MSTATGEVALVSRQREYDGILLVRKCSDGARAFPLVPVLGYDLHVSLNDVKFDRINIFSPMKFIHNVYTRRRTA